MKAMILAAGRGERMRPLTDECPKALLQVGGKALIEYHIEALARSGIAELVINTAWLGEQLPASLGDGSRFGVSIQYSDEGASALETGGGIAKALPQLGDEPFWLVNGDVWCDYGFNRMNLAPDELGHLVLVRNPEHNPAGDFGLVDGRIRNSGAARYTFSGLSLLRPELVRGKGAGKFPLAPLLRNAADDNRLSGELHTGEWIDVGTPERLRDVDALLADRA